MGHPVNPWLYPMGETTMGYTYHHLRDQAATLEQGMERALSMVRHRIGETLHAAGYARPTHAALASALAAERTYDHALDAEELNYRFPEGPRPGVQLALIDAYWNRWYVSEGGRGWDHHTLAQLTPPVPASAYDLYLDLHTGDWCAFTHDTSMGAPIGEHATHTSPATAYPQPGGTHAQP